jgi:hypothetical protein
MSRPSETLDHLVDQPGKTPTRKWFAATGTGGVSVVVVWIAGQLGLDMPAEVAAALVLGAAQLAAYVKRNTPALVDCLDGEPGEHAADR